MSRSTPAAIARTIASYRPRGVSDETLTFARALVARAEPGTPERAKALLFAASRLASFAEAVGLCLSPEELLCEAVIERFLLQGTAALSPASRRTLRSNLRALGRALGSHPQPLPVPLGRERAKAPYSEAEIEGFLRLAACQPTEARRMRCSAVVCLGAGAGIVQGELRLLRGSDVVERCGGVVVAVPGKRARAVPVLRRHHGPLLAAAAFAGRSFIAGGENPARRNITDALVSALCSDPSLPRLEGGRLRSTWLSACARAIGRQAFMAAAGVVCSQRLGDIVATLPLPEMTEMVALLGGSR